MARKTETPPNRASLKRLALREPVLAAAIAAHERGRMSYEQALRVAIIALCDQMAVYRARMSQQERRRLEDLRLGKHDVSRPEAPE